MVGQKATGVSLWELCWQHGFIGKNTRENLLLNETERKLFHITENETHLLTQHRVEDV